MAEKQEFLITLPDRPYEKMSHKLTRREKEEMAVYYYTHDVTQTMLADMYGVSQNTANKVVNDLKIMKAVRGYLDKEMQKSDIRRNIAMMKALNAAPDAMEQLVKIASKNLDETPIQYQYVIQNAAKEILDRAGVKPVEEENQNEIVVRFADPEGIFNPGMPDLENGTVVQGDDTE